MGENIIPKENLKDDPDFAEIDAQTDKIDQIIERIKETGSFIEAINNTPAQGVSRHFRHTFESHTGGTNGQH